MKEKEVIFINIAKKEYNYFIKKNNYLIKEIALHQSSYPSPYFYLNKEYALPYRIGCSKQEIVFENKQEEILKYCLLTRHHDGFIRQQAVQQLIYLCRKECPIYVYPYIVRLLGEYVQEIWQIIYDNRYLFYSDEIATFIKENNKFMETNKARGITYWYEYYRGDYPLYKQTPSYQYFKWVTDVLG